MPEILEKSQTNAPPETVPRFISPSDFFKEMSAPTSRFRSPLNLFEKIHLYVSGLLSRYSLAAHVPFALESSFPLNWQVLLNYLYKKGIIAQPLIIFGQFRNDKPKLFSGYLPARFDPSRTDAPKYSFGGYASEFDVEKTISKTVGELLERYFGTLFKRDSFLKGSIKDMRASGRKFLDPQTLCQFEEWQKERFPMLAYSADSSFSWIPAEELTSATKRYMPAQLAYWLYQKDENFEPTLNPLTTNGGAGHFTRTEAIIGGIREGIERDAFLIYWLNTLSPKVIDIESWNDDDVQQKLRYLKRFGVSVYFLNITTDIPIPVSACLLIQNEGGESRMGLGASTGSNAKDSFLKSCSEAISTLSHMETSEPIEPIDFTSYQPFVDKNIDRTLRIRLWKGAAMYERIRFFISGTSQSVASFEESFKKFSSPQEELEFLVEIFRRRGKGYEVYVHEIKNSILKKIGFHVVKVVIPSLVPMYLNEHLATLAATRLQEVPQKIGYTTTVRNPYPHIFP